MILLLICCFFIHFSASSPMNSQPKRKPDDRLESLLKPPRFPPRARSWPHQHNHHNEIISDDFHWLKDENPIENPEIISYLEVLFLNLILARK